jgi:hypothetical protein
MTLIICFELIIVVFFETEKIKLKLVKHFKIPCFPDISYQLDKEKKFLKSSFKPFVNSNFFLQKSLKSTLYKASSLMGSSLYRENRVL